MEPGTLIPGSHKVEAPRLVTRYRIEAALAGVLATAGA